jgi:hypothetical protein
MYRREVLRRPKKPTHPAVAPQDFAVLCDAKPSRMASKRMNHLAKPEDL